MVERPPVAARPIAAVTVVLVVVLTALSQGYDYHRDELYYRMLPTEWGYVDQPPLAPLLADLTRLLADEPWALRIPSTLALAASVTVVALIARELGGGALAQGIAAVAHACSAATMILGHVLLTSSLDLLVWPLVCLLVMRALLRDQARWWVWAGLVAGLSSYNKLLVVWLLLGIAVGLLVLGPRRPLRSPGLVAGCAVAFVVALPNVVYQVAHGWPQLDMGAALAENNAGEVRWFMWVLLLIVLGPPLVPIWVAGLVGLLRRPAWRPVRCLVGALAVVLVFTFVSGAQPHYPTGLLVVLLAVGAVPAAELATRSRAWGGALVAAVALNAGMAVLIGLPVLPTHVLGNTPIPAMSTVAADQVGWRAHADRIADVAAAHGTTVVVASNYGEAGAVDRYAPELDVFSGHNALHDAGPPPEGTDAFVFVGEQLGRARELFDGCEVVSRLDNGVGVDNEEQGVPVAVCGRPTSSWVEAWPRLRHLD